MRLLANENVTRTVIEELRQRGHDVLSGTVTYFLAIFCLTLTAGFGFVSGKPLQVIKGSRLTETEESSLGLDPNGYPLPPGAVNRIGSNLHRHYGAVSRLLYLPDVQALASTSWDGYLHVWDTRTNKLRWRFRVDKRSSQPELAVSGDGKKLAVLSDFECVVVAADTGEKLARHEWRQATGGEKVRCLAMSPDMSTLARGCFDATVRFYDTVTGQETVRIAVGEKTKDQFPLAVAFSADSKTIYVLANEKPGILVFDTKTGQAAPTLEIAKTLGYLSRLVLSPKHDLLAAMGPARVVLWDLAAGKQRHLIEKELASWRCGDFSPDGNLFAVGGIGTDIVVFDTATGKERQRLQPSADTISMLFPPDGKTLAVADTGGRITLWDLQTGKPVSPWPEPTGLKHVRFADHGKQILCLGDNIGWWDVTSAKPVRLLTRDPKWYYSPSVSPDGKLLAASLFKGDVVLVDVATARHLRTLTGHKSAVDHIAFSPDGAKLFSAAARDPRILIWDVATGKLLQELKSHTEFMSALAVSPDGRWLASARSAGDYDISLWEAATGKLVRRLKPRHGPAFSMVFSADSSRLASVGPGLVTNSGEVQLWDAATGAEVRAFTAQKGTILCVALSADARMLITGGEDKTLRLWEVASGQERGHIIGHQDRVFSMDLSPNGRLLAAASADAPVYLWDVYAVQKPQSPSAMHTTADRDKLWQRLGDTDAAEAFASMCELIARRDEAVALLEDGWTKLPRATSKQMRKWVEDLNSSQYSLRKTATAELQRFATEHDDLLREALKQPASLETRMRLEQVLGRLNPQQLLRRSRMLEVLEQVGTAPARRFLEVLLEQKDDALMSREAAAGLKRLERKQSR